MAVRTYLSVIIFYVNGLKCSSQETDNKTHVLVAYESFMSDLKHRDWNVEWKKILHVIRNEKEAGLAILGSDTTDFKTD